MVAFSGLYAAVLARIKTVEPTASFEVSHYVLSLGDADATTGHYAMEYAAPATIEAIIVTKGTQQSIMGMGYHVRRDALAFTLTAVVDGDEIKDANNLWFKVDAVRPVPAGDANVTYVADLVYLPLHT